MNSSIFYKIRKYLLRFWIFRDILKRPYMFIQKKYFQAIASRNLMAIYKSVRDNSKKIFYLDVPTHPNLGDLAQYYCIKEWLSQNYPDYIVIEISAQTIVYAEREFIQLLKRIIIPGDMVFFQSGYCTQDLGGTHDYVHRLVVENFSDIPVVMLPQTILYQNPDNATRTANVYKTHKKLLLMCRDSTSYLIAEKLFPENKLLLYPDIVTSLIGSMDINSEKQRKGILICCRNDSEKYYNDSTIRNLEKSLKEIDDVIMSDTTVNCDFAQLKLNIRKYVFDMISDFRNYRVIITDRYHGTIFSLIAGTPVLVIKSNDHKVVTGVDWFKGHYDDTVRYVGEITDVPLRVKELYESYEYHKLKPVFKENYYDELKSKIIF